MERIPLAPLPMTISVNLSVQTISATEKLDSGLIAELVVVGLRQV
jgi:hypothetical protein